MATRIPDPLKRRHLVEGDLDPAKALALAEAYLAEGRSQEAVAFLGCDVSNFTHGANTFTRSNRREETNLLKTVVQAHEYFLGNNTVALAHLRQK